MTNKHGSANPNKIKKFSIQTNMKNKTSNIDTLIQTKISNGSHSKKDIKYIVDSYTRGNISNKKMTAWLKAVYFNGMDLDETINYTNAIINSGKKIQFNNLNGFAIDKHSTGGVGDKVSIILGPILAACGCYVPMIVGRALGHTGGTLDKLESIPNYNGLLSINKFKNIVNKIGISIIGQTDEICPADKKIYNLRSKTDTIASFPLICGSIMGKKIAEGIKGLVLDIKAGNGAFMQTKKEALDLGSFLKKIGERYGIEVQFAITDMNQPLGNYSGLLCEIIESMETLKGNGPKDLLEVIYYLGDISLKMTGINDTKTKINEVISNGSAYEVLCKMIHAHGGLIEEIQLIPRETDYIRSEKDGYIVSINTQELGKAINELSIEKQGDNIVTDSQAGLELLKKNGSYVKKNDIIAHIFSSNRNKLTVAKKRIEKTFIIKDKKINANKIIIY